jgi:carboxylate-amine ligase
VGVEEEFLLVAPHGPGLVDMAATVALRAGGDPRTHLELPPCQIEMVSPPRRSVAEVEADLRAARQDLLRWCGEVARPVAAAVHPLCARFEGRPLHRRGEDLVHRYGPLARQQLVSSLQVHVAPGTSTAALGIYNLLRNHLPLLAALGAAAPFADGRDAGMASVRPLVAGSLPRQGTPPVLESWDHYAHELAWGARTGALADPTFWWWELRPHPVHGTLEVRVLDAQPTTGHAMALVELVVALVRALGDQVGTRHAPEPAPTWRIDENRWSAMGHGLDGTMADVQTGEVEATRTVVERLIDRVEPWAERGLDGARRLAADPHPRRLRAVGADAAVDWLVDAYRAGL